MSPTCSDLELFFDGELPADAAASFPLHIADCARCQRVLRGRMQEEMITDGADPPAVRAAPPRRPLLYVAPVLAAAAAVAIWLVGTRGPAADASIDLVVAIDHTGGTRSGVAQIGDVVRGTVRGDGHRALWVYRGDREVVAACPGAAACAGDAQQTTLELRLGAPGSYSIIAIVSPQPIAQPQGAVDVMLSAATSAGAHVKITPIEVH